MEAAFSLQGTESVRDIFPESNASTMRRILITLVTEAGLNCSCILWAYKILPEDCSIKIAQKIVQLK